jgi:hypothetical protein
MQETKQDLQNVVQTVDMRAILQRSLHHLPETIPVLCTGIAGCSWWVVALAAALTIFLKGTDPAMRWLDVIDRLRSDRARTRDGRFD